MNKRKLNNKDIQEQFKIETSFTVPNTTYTEYDLQNIKEILDNAESNTDVDEIDTDGIEGELNRLRPSKLNDEVKGIVKDALKDIVEGQTKMLDGNVLLKKSDLESCQSHIEDVSKALENIQAYTEWLEEKLVEYKNSVVIRRKLKK